MAEYRVGDYLDSNAEIYRLPEGTILHWRDSTTDRHDHRFIRDNESTNPARTLVYPSGEFTGSWASDNGAMVIDSFPDGITSFNTSIESSPDSPRGFLPTPPRAAPNPELEAFKKQVAEKMKALAVENNWCGVARRGLNDLGIDWPTVEPVKVGTVFEEWPNRIDEAGLLPGYVLARGNGNLYKILDRSVGEDDYSWEQLAGASPRDRRPDDGLYQWTVVHAE